MESKATNILNDIMQKLSAISEPETKKVENIEVAAEEVTESHQERCGHRVGPRVPAGRAGRGPPHRPGSPHVQFN